MTKVKEIEASQSDPQSSAASAQTSWLRADYMTHIFHYRMPETVAIAAVNPIVPSPLTVKMALIAAFLREGRRSDAGRVVRNLPHIEVRIRPPSGAIVFKAFMRYVRVPAIPKKGQKIERDGVTGGYYGVSPHVREYALWSDQLSIFVKIPQRLRVLIEEGLRKIPYLGAKDSLVTCTNVAKEKPPEEGCVMKLTPDDIAKIEGFVVRLADFNPERPIQDVLKVLPAQRDDKDYEQELYSVPGKLQTHGKVKIYQREGE